MTPLRQRMVEDMQLRGFAARTQEAYLTSVCQLTRHYQRSPDEISDEELRQYFLYLVNGEGVPHLVEMQKAPSMMTNLFDENRLPSHRRSLDEDCSTDPEGTEAQRCL